MTTESWYAMRLSEHAKLPVRGSALAAGWDLASSEDTVVPARGRAVVKTNLAIAIPHDCYARVAPREVLPMLSTNTELAGSGLAAKKAIDVGAGVVDADYRGEIGVVLFNHGDADFEVKRGDRIAQLILEKVHLDATLIEKDELPNTARGASGFGSTGVASDPPAKKFRPITPLPEDEAQSAELAAKYADLERKHADLEREHADLKRKNADLERKHADLERKLDALLASLGGEAGDAR